MTVPQWGCDMVGVKNGIVAKIKLMNAAALYETAVNDCIKIQKS